MRLFNSGCLLLVALGGAGFARAAEAPPNVVLIVGDDQAWFDFGFLGAKEIRTPHLDRLAAQSALFPRGYVPTSVCNPSLAAIITGRYPHETRIGVGVHPPGVPNVVRRQFQQFPALPALLGAKGYQSLQTGKWWEGDCRLAGFTHGMTTGTPVPDSALAIPEGTSVPSGIRRLDKGLLYMGGAEGLRIGRETMQPIYDFVKQCRGSPGADAPGSPFFIWYAPMLPHTPHNPPDRLLTKYRQADRPESVARYMAMCEWFDETVGDMLGFLDREGLSQNTLVAFAVDNGYIPAPSEDKSFFAPRSKLSPYEAGHRTPILVRWPKRIRPARYETLVHTIDIAPTVLAASGVEAPAGLPGINLLDVCAGKPVARDAVFGATFRRKAEKPGDPAETVDYRWCIQGDWKLIAPVDTAAPAELYEIVADPRETRNVAAAYPERVQALQQRLDKWWKIN